MMLLTIDIGNTNISYGIFKGEILIKKGKIPTESPDYLRYLRNFPWEDIGEIIICSVVPQGLKRLRNGLKKFFPKKPFILGENISVPMKNLYKKPEEVGQDRLVNAYAGYYFYGGNLVVIDFGTAVTFDVVSGRGEYLGGMIFPGLRTSLEALCQKAALLPKNMDFTLPKGFIGVSTKESILSGIFNGFLAMTRQLVQILKEKQGIEKVVFTGGDASKLYPYLADLGTLRETLILEGLRLIYENKKSNK
ncbi:MAG: type III pantothenate kinase [Candidatus Omnitrophica bacterium]|nr:type III pantothenate kinase [Candidatus Omnitrophota bacterium]